MNKLILVSISIVLTTFSFGLNPSKDYAVLPSDFEMAYEEISIPTTDGLKLKGWYFKPKIPSQHVVILSDDGNGNMSDLLEQVGLFLSLNYNVITYDYRGFGQSDSFRISNKFFIYTKFVEDLQSTINYATTTYNNVRRVILYGIGIGAGLSVCVGAAESKVVYIISDSPYSSFEDIKKRIKEVKGEDILLPIGHDKIKIEPKYALEVRASTAKVKILYICGGDDEICTSKDIKMLIKIRPVTSSSFIVKGADASNTYSVDKESYYEKIRAFLK